MSVSPQFKKQAGARTDIPKVGSSDTLSNASSPSCVVTINEHVQSTYRLLLVKEVQLFPHHGSINRAPTWVYSPTYNMASERQAENAVRFYESRAVHYDGTWHDDFTSRFIKHVDIAPGQEILDLACGTGLLTFLESDVVGPSGTVIGVDVTLAMLDVARFKQRKAGDKYSNVTFLEGDVLHLEELEMLKGKTFDVITLASALVLFPDPKAAIEHWSQFLKPGGIIAVDATHPRNLIPGMVLERVARRLSLPMPYNRSWSKSESTLKDMLESAGLEVKAVITIDNQAGYGRRSYDLEQWDDFFVENVIVKDVTRVFANNDIRRKAQALYKEEWEKLAIGGKVEEVDSVFLGVARRRECPPIQCISLDFQTGLLTKVQLPTVPGISPRL